MFFKKSSPNTRKKFYYTFKITQNEYLLLRKFLKENKLPYKKRFTFRYKLGINTIISLSLAIILLVLLIVFIKII